LGFGGFIELGQYPFEQGDVDTFNGIGQERRINLNNCLDPTFELAFFLKVSDIAGVWNRFVSIQGSFNPKLDGLFRKLDGFINAVICSRKASG